MHSKDYRSVASFQYPTPKEACLIKNGHCFLMRNLLKVSDKQQKIYYYYLLFKPITVKINLLRRKVINFVCFFNEKKKLKPT